MKQDILQTAKIIALGAILALGVSFAHAVWVGPTAPPPLNNASAPLNVSNITQTKAGDIILDDGVNTAGLAADKVVSSEYCIGSGPDCITAWPSSNTIDTILCTQTGSRRGGPGLYTFNFTPADCGGTLPDANYVGMGVHFGINEGFITWQVNQAPTPGVSIWSHIGPNGGYEFTALYIRR